MSYNKVQFQGVTIRDPIARDLRTPKYKARVVPTSKQYNRSKDKRLIQREYLQD